MITLFDVVLISVLVSYAVYVALYYTRHTSVWAIPILSVLIVLINISILFMFNK